MKKQIRKFAIMLILIVTITLIHKMPVFAAETNNNNTSNTTSSANLINLGITPNDFTGFKENTTSYNVTVPNNVKSVNVYAKAKESTSTITGTGKLELEEGKNKASVVVTAKDGTTKTYTINIKRLKDGENTSSDITEIDEELGLNNLEIEGLSLEPSFDTNVHQYTVNIQNSIKELKFDTEATKEDAVIKIKGNTNLIKGQNIVTILVSDENEKSVSTYQIYVNNGVVKPEQVDDHYKDAKISNEVKKWITIILSLTVIVCLLILKRLIRLKREEREENDNITNEETIKSIQKIRENFDNINKQIQEETKKQQKRAKHGKHSK